MQVKPTTERKTIMQGITYMWNQKTTAATNKLNFNSETESRKVILPGMGVEENRESFGKRIQTFSYKINKF